MIAEKVIEQIQHTKSGFIVEKINILGHDYEISFTWKSRIYIEIKPIQHVFQYVKICKIRKMQLASIITRSPSYGISGKRNELTEKILSNKFTPILLSFPQSVISCENNYISYKTTLRKKKLLQVEKVIQYFEDFNSSLK